MRLTYTGLYKAMWALNYEAHDDAVLEVDVRFQEGDERATAGLMCRASSNNRAHAYFFLISANGAFSIRRGNERSADPLVKWQSHRAIHTDGRANRIRAVCVGDYMGMYVNETYLDGAWDTGYNSGMTGLVVKLPDNTQEGATAAVLFDNLRVWEAALRD